MKEKLVELLRKPIEMMPGRTGTPYIQFTMPYAEELADHLIANGVTVQEWISVKDRLPEQFVDVLVFRNGNIKIDHHEENGWFAYDFNGKRATHWMPLPQPPKGE